MNMRPLAIVGVLLVLLGIAALVVPTFTFFTTERVADVGFFTMDFSKPHTIVFNPFVGVILLVVGIALVFVGFRTRSA